MDGQTAWVFQAQKLAQKAQMDFACFLASSVAHSVTTPARLGHYFVVGRSTKSFMCLAQDSMGIFLVTPKAAAETSKQQIMSNGLFNISPP